MHFHKAGEAEIQVLLGNKVEFVIVNKLLRIFKFFFSAHRLLMNILHAVVTLSSAWCCSIAKSLESHIGHFLLELSVNSFWFWVFMNTAVAHLPFFICGCR